MMSKKLAKVAAERRSGTTCLVSALFTGKLLLPFRKLLQRVSFGQKHASAKFLVSAIFAHGSEMSSTLRKIYIYTDFSAVSAIRNPSEITK